MNYHYSKIHINNLKKNVKRVDPDVTLFVNNIRFLCKEHQITQADANRTCGVTYQYLQVALHQQALPNSRVLYEFARLFDVSMEELITVDMSKCR